MKKNKSLLIIGTIAIALVILIFSGALILGNYIENELQDSQIGTYNIQSREASVNIFLRRVTIKGVVAEDSATHQKFVIPEIRATGIHILPFIFNEKVIINNLRIQNPEISLMQEKPEEKKEKRKKTGAESDREIELLRIKQLEIADAVLSLQQQAAEGTDTVLSMEAGLELWNLNIFSDREQLIFKTHSAEKLQVKVNNVRYNLPGGLYLLQFDSLEYDTGTEALSLKNLYFSSVHSKYEIAKQTGVETDWYDITLKQFDMEGINMDALLRETSVIFRSAVLEGLDAVIFRDKRPPFPDKPDTKLPMGMLNSLPLAMDSDSILIKNASVVYEEHAEESTEPGKVTFNRLFATIYNLGTIQDSIDGQTAMTARAFVMNESLLKVEFVFPNNEFSYQYQASGSLEPLNLKALNPMLVPAAFVRIEEGRINRMDFDFTYDENTSEGSLTLEYENLNINLLDKKDGSQKKIKTFLTETFVLNKENLKENNSYQEGTISAEREKKKSIFNYWWKSLFSGIKDVLAF